MIPVIFFRYAVRNKNTVVLLKKQEYSSTVSDMFNNPTIIECDQIQSRLVRG